MRQLTQLREELGIRVFGRDEAEMALYATIQKVKDKQINPRVN